MRAKKQKQKLSISPPLQKTAGSRKSCQRSKPTALGLLQWLWAQQFPGPEGCLASFSTLFFQNSLKKKKKKTFNCHVNAIALFFYFLKGKDGKNANFIIINGTCVCRGLRLPYLEGTCDGVGICCPQRPPAPVELTYNDRHVPRGPGSSPYQLWKGQEEVFGTWRHSCKAACPLELLQVTSDPRRENRRIWTVPPGLVILTSAKNSLEWRESPWHSSVLYLSRGNFWNSACKSKPLIVSICPTPQIFLNAAYMFLTWEGFTATQDLLIVVSLALTLSLVYVCTALLRSSG